MIKGLYEVHLQVSDLRRSLDFYERLGLEVAHLYEERDPPGALLWVERRRSWIGLWQGEVPHIGGAARHIAFEIDYSDMPRAFEWLRERGIEPVGVKGFAPREPMVRPEQQNCSVFFEDPDGNQLELLCNLPEGPRDLPRHFTLTMYLSEWEKHRQRHCAMRGNA